MNSFKSGKLKLVIVAVIGLVLGSAGGAYAAHSFLSEFFLYGFYTGEAAKARIELNALRAIRSGDVDKAITILELNTMGSLVLIENSKEEAPKSTHSSLNQTLSEIRKYEKDFNVNISQDAGK